MKQLLNKIKIFIITFFVLCSMVLKIEPVDNSSLISITQQESPWIRAIVALRLSFIEYNWTFLIVIGTVFAFFSYALKITIDRRAKKIACSISIFFALFQILGESYDKTNSWQLLIAGEIYILKSIFMLIGFYFLSYYIVILFFYKIIPKIQELSFDWINNFSSLFSRYHNFLGTNKITIFQVSTILLIFWLPYIIFLYPGNITTDTQDSISQILNDAEHCWSYKYVILQNENVLLNNFHPLAYTLLVGIFVHLGDLLSNWPLAFECFCIIQSIVLALVFGVTIWYMARKRVPLILRILSLIFYALCPLMGMYAVTAIKDVPYTIAVICTTLFLIEFSLCPGKILGSNKLCALFILGMVMMTFMRNNGIYVICITAFIAVIYLFYLKILKQHWKKLCLLFGIPIILYSVILLNIIAPILQAGSGSKNEIFSIPFQQIARYTIEYGDDIRLEERLIIEEVLKDKDITALENKYNPKLSDPVKKAFINNISDQQLRKLASVWLKWFLRHPDSFIQAMLNNVYSYFYFDTDVQLRHWCSGSGNHAYVRYAEIFEFPREMISICLDFIQKSPITFWSVNMAFYFWGLMICIGYFIWKKKYFWILGFGCIYINFLITLLGPIAYTRYALPLIFCFPLMLSTCFFAHKNDDKLLFERRKEGN